MASTSDGMGRKKPKFSSMRQPPLIKQLKGILAEYPDGGQILKELIQNAEDAEASVVDIIFDNKNSDETFEPQCRYSNFFQGPAICLYNDALFEDDDWEGIKMIYSSKKEKNRLKVGRFGLGFKSVFHVTDYPSILSGDKVLLINPHEEWNVNAEFDLHELAEYEGIDVNQFLKAFNGIHGINEETIKKGEFQGTLFRFPLRKHPSNLSDNIYDEKRVDFLFEAFLREISSILLFLKHLTKVSLNRKENGHITHIGSVEIVDNVDGVKEERRKFNRTLAQIGLDYKGESLKSVVDLSLETTMNQIKKRTTWTVVNVFMGNNASTHFQELIRDESVTYSPCVGIASPHGDCLDDFEGRIFCFLPLPNEGTKQTGFPFHINGFFALSQNRHHLKWATDEQRGQKITDKSILWNQCLLEEALPFAFRVFLEFSVETSTKKSCQTEFVNQMYRRIPNHANALEKWMPMIQRMFQGISSLPFLHVKNTSTWVTISDALFATFRSLQGEKTIKENIVDALLSMNKKYVEIPFTLFHSIQSFSEGISDLSPGSFASFLRQSDQYKELPYDVKIGITIFLLHEGNYELLDGLELLPLQSGKWTRFDLSLQASKVLVCTDEEMQLIPGLENEILQRMKSLPKTLQNHLCRLIEKGLYNLAKFNNENPPALIQRVLHANLGFQHPISIQSSSKLNMHWLKCVWEYFLHAPSKIANIPLLPVLRGTWENPQEIILKKLNDILLLADESFFEDGSFLCFEYLSVIILPSLPDWIPLDKVKEYIYCPTPASLGKLISRIGSSSSSESIIKQFNTLKDGSDGKIISIDNFLKRLHSLKTNDTSSISFLKKLDLFKQTSSPGSAIEYVSIDRNSNFITCTTFPVRYPKKLILCRNETVPFMKLLQAVEVTNIDLIKLSIQAIHDKKYSKCEIETFMSYFIEQMKVNDFDESIIQLARKVNFLKCDGQLKMPSELFNPKDKQLRKLFDDMSLFPDDTDYDDTTLKVLTTLGLRKCNDISEDDILRVATYIDKKSGDNNTSTIAETKSTALIKYLKHHHYILQRTYNKRQVWNYLNDLCWLKVNENKPRAYPECLQLFSSSQTYYRPSEVTSIDWSLVIGSTMPLVDINEKTLLTIFRWENEPPLSNVIRHLQNLQMCYTDDCKPEVSVVVKEVYKVLNGNREKTIEALENMENKCIIWNGNGFSEPSDMIVCKSQNDINIEPYFSYIPPEFTKDFSELLVQIGCHQDQDIDILLSCIHRVNDQYLTSIKSKRNIKKDLEMITCILEDISYKQDNLTPERKARILLPILSTVQDKLILKPVLQCAYTNTPEEIDPEEEDIYFVHECISEKIIKALEVKSLFKQTLSETEGLEADEWGQSESLTMRINTLLKEGYKDGLSVPKELIQNADDAGAECVKFLYDERENENRKTKLLSHGMKECQGPALWVFNDAFFTDSDFINLIKLNGATKKTNTDKIGRFGLGFCSVYNLTDVPSLLSGSTLVILDPHKTHLGGTLPGNSPGMKINFSTKKNKTVLRKFKDQFIPYQNVFQCTASSDKFNINGTLFRFPLRTVEQSGRSEISGLPYTKKQMKKLIEMFIASAGDSFLFTQNIQQIEVYHLEKDAKSPLEMKQIFTVCRKIEKVYKGGLRSNVRSCNILNRVAQNILNTPFSEIQLLHITSKIYEDAKQIIDVGFRSSRTSWVVSWSTGDVKDEVLFECKKEGALPLAAIAVPFSNSEPINLVSLSEIKAGFKKEGHLFCFLQLPERTGLQFHINACFGVTSDRRHLFIDSEDDKRSFHSIWNEIILRNAVVNAFINLLLQLTHELIPREYNYCFLWPRHGDETTHCFVESFYQRIVNNNICIFKAHDSWICFENAVILDPIIRECDIGDIALKMLQRFSPRQNKKIIEMEMDFLKLLHLYNKDIADRIDNSVIKEEEMLVHLLKTIHEPEWDEIERDKMVIFSLKSDRESVRDLLKDTECIPSEPHGKLCKPNKLVNPKSEVGKLFENVDGYFPSNNTAFIQDDILSILCTLGMKYNILPHDILLNRCSSVLHLATKCNTCALDRSILILKYLDRKAVLDDLETNSETLKIMRNIEMLPIMQCPNFWTLKWGANLRPDHGAHMTAFYCQKHEQTLSKKISFGRPSEMYRKDTFLSIGMINLIVDEPKGTQRALNALNMKGRMDILIGTLKQQIQAVVFESRNKDNFKLLKKILIDIFNILRLHITKESFEKEERVEEMSLLMQLSYEQIIPINDHLVAPKDIAFKIDIDCRPYIYKLPEIYKRKYKLLFRAFGIRDEFCVKDILEVMLEHLKPKCQKMIEKEEPIQGLLYNLYKRLEKENVKYDDLKDQHDVILAPDENKILRPTSQLAIQEGDFQTKQELHMIHESISLQIAQKLGVRRKERMCLKKISRGIPFGQKESLVTRLNGLLKAYPADSSIMKELLQNADDACATELCFIKDLQTHKFDTSFGCKKINEPSLCVYNNTSFSEDDLLGIQNLGKGSKGDDVTKTGQFGVGFNAVYHLTDIPSFLSIRPGYKHDGTLCIFDPLFENIPDLEEPGLRCELDGVKEDFPDVLLGFCERMWTKECTIFRFPLRTSVSEISKNEVTKDNLVSLLNDFKSEMFEVLLFLKNVTCIKLLDITSGQIKEEYVVRAHMSDQDKEKRDLFFKHIKQVSDKNRMDKSKNLEEEQKMVHYEMRIEDSEGRIQNWLIVQNFGFNDAFKDGNSLVIRAFKNNDLGHLPLGGIALPITDFTKRKREGLYTEKKKKAFCFLPLPIETNLPVHVNGHFAVDAARRYLMEDSFRQEWNMKLVEHTIIPSWVLGILTVIKMKINPLLSPRNTKDYLLKLIDAYNLYLPRANAENSFWRDSVRLFYENIYINEIEIFPFLDILLIKNDRLFTLKWTKIYSKTCKWTGVFDTIEKHCTLFGICPDKQRQISYVLKKLGMKIIETPLDIQSTLTQFDMPTNEASPDNVITFLKSFSSNDMDSCSLGAIDHHIIKTRFENVENLAAVVAYSVTDDNFLEKSNGLPILLSSDRILHVCSLENQVFLTEFFDILPKSPEQFLHSCLIPLFQKYLNKASYLKDFTIEAFLRMLPISCDQNTYKKGLNAEWEKTDAGVVTRSWLCRVFDFIYKKSNKSYDQFKINVNYLRDWSFLPASIDVDGEKYKYRIPIKFSYMLLKDISMESSLTKVLKKINLPYFDKSIFRMRNQEYFPFADAIESLVSSEMKPIELLNCLVAHRDNIKKIDLRPDDAFIILAYFAGRVPELRDFLIDRDMPTLFKQLPLYVTHDNALVSIDTQRVAVLPACLPINGIKELANAIGVTLLRESKEARVLYEYLHLSSPDAFTFYTETFIPNIRKVQKIHLAQHIKFMRDNIFYSTKTNELFKMLKNVPFIEYRGTWKRVSDFYDRLNPVFDMMCQDNEFLPESHQGSEWRSFLTKLGLIIHVSDEDLIRFASKIEADGKDHMDEIIKKKSKTLEKCLISRKNTWKQETLLQLCTIKFIVPYVVTDNLTQIHGQPERATKLICFEGSVNSSKEIMCWTTCNLISESVCRDIDDKTKENLHLRNSPVDQDVIRHCQLVCACFSASLKKNLCTIDADFVKWLMEKFYDYFETNNLHIKVKENLKHTQFIYVPEQCEIVSVHWIVVDQSDTLEDVNPYLYKAPTYYGKYHDFFEKIGCHAVITCSLLMNVLEKIYLKTENMKRNIDIQLVKNVLQRFFRVLERNDSSKNITADKKLYLPNERGTLMNAKDVIFPDNTDFMYRLEEELRGKIFMGFKKLGIYTPDGTSLLKNLPLYVRPQFLSEIVSEKTLHDNMTEVEHSEIAELLNNFIQTPELLGGIVRLIKSSCSNVNISHDLISEIKSQLLKVICIEVKGLETILEFNGKIMQGSERIKHCSIIRSQENISFYFQTQDDNKSINRLIYEPDGLRCLIDVCIGYQISETDLMAVLMCYNTNDSINSVLDKRRIPAIDIPNEFKDPCFPVPGTYVEKEMIPFLDRTIRPFRKQEYKFVALQLKDSDEKEQKKEPMYIYVYIYEEIKAETNMKISYKVKTGNTAFDFTEVPIYELYRFLPQESILKDNYEMPNTEEELQATCLEVKQQIEYAFQISDTAISMITERLLLKWYIAKNNNNDYAMKVFDYINEVVFKLENNEPIPDRPNTTSRNFDNSKSRFLSSFRRSVYYGRTYAEKHRFFQNENPSSRTSSGNSWGLFWQQYQRRGSRGRRNYHGSGGASPVKRAKISDVTESKRWLKQAKLDYSAAVESSDTASSSSERYNWVCYISHQACEKAMKAVWFFRDAENTLKHSHELMKLASGIGEEFVEKATLIETKIIDYSRMRYPDTVTRPKIPADMYTHEDAKFCLERAKEIIELAEESICI